MGIRRSIANQVGSRVVPRLAHTAPGATQGFVREALNRAISGVGPLPGAVAAAAKQLEEQDGDVERAVREVIENHVTYAGAGGFASNVGGLVTAAVTVPANISGLALIHCRMIAAIAHLRGYDIEDPRVRNAILVCLLGEEKVDRLVKQAKLPAPPMAIATAPAHDPDLEKVIAAEVATELVSKIAGTRIAVVVGRRVPVLGGVVGAGVDGFATYRIGRYASRELLPRNQR